MKTRIFILCGLAALLAGGPLVAADEPAEQTAAESPSGDTTIATINDQEISLDLFRRFYVERLRQTNEQNTPAFQNRVFNDFVNMLVTAQDAQKTGLDKDKGFALALEIQRLQLLSGFAIENAANTLTPSDEDVQKAYDERYGNEKQIEYKARHILVKTEDEGKKLITELDGGADFAELAKIHSLGPTGKDGGELPWFGAGQMVQAFTDATAALKAGEHSGTPVQTQFGWHVILLEEMRESEPPPLEDVKNELSQALRRSMLTRYVEELRGKAKLDVNPDLITISKVGESEPAKEEAEPAKPE
jgi:peptidyl-prolyl cis-trans isomerase C